MYDFSNILKYAFTLMQYAGMVIGAIGIYRWVSGGKAHDASAQEGAAWVIITGIALAVVGAYMANQPVPTLQ